MLAYLSRRESSSSSTTTTTTGREAGGINGAKSPPSSSRNSSHGAEGDDDVDGLPPPPPLDWRMDPFESFSDWRIVVRCVDSDASKILGEKETVVDEATFFVHRTVLAYGPRRCSYFSTLLRNRSFAESANSTSYVVVPSRKIATDVVPLLLDYMYSGSDALKNTKDSEEIAALHHLADRFGNESLKEEVEQIISESLCLYETAPLYYQSAKTLNNERLYDMVVRDAANCIESGWGDPDANEDRIFYHADLNFWLAVMEKAGCVGSDWIRAIVESNMYDNDMTPELFRQLTSRESMGYLSLFDIVPLLELEETIVYDEDDDDPNLSDLQEWCVKEMAEEKEELTGEYGPVDLNYVFGRPKLIALLFTQVSADYDSTNKRLRNAVEEEERDNKRLRRDLASSRADNAKLRKQRDEAKEKAGKIQSRVAAFSGELRGLLE